MSVICPACETRFRDPPAHVAASRPLQCGNCEHEWVRATVSAPPMAPDFEDLSDSPSLAVAQHGGAANFAAKDNTTNSIYVDTVSEKAARPAFRHGGLLAASLVGATLLTGAVVARSEIVAVAPQTVALYEAVGLGAPATLHTAGLSITNVTTTRTRKDGISRLIVRGEIANGAAASVTVPPLTLTMRGEADQKVFAWKAKAAADKLGAGERATFTAVASDYPESAVDVEVTFERATN